MFEQKNSESFKVANEMKIVMYILSVYQEKGGFYRKIE